MKTIRIDALTLLRDKDACEDGVIEFLEKFRDGLRFNSRKSLATVVRQVLNAGYTWEDVFYYATGTSIENVQDDLAEEAYNKATEAGDDDADFDGYDIWESLPMSKKLDILWKHVVAND